jgi:predicted double-glycine peptidase
MLRARRAGLFMFAVASCLLVSGAGASASQIYLNGLTIGSGTATVKVQSFQARKFSTTVHQEFDFSCGSAALATLITFTYHRPSTEADIFASMFENGDQALIREYGFSLLDMKNYLTRIGLPSGGFRAPLSKLAEVHVPAIVLINEHGYRHFVVIRGIRDDKVLLADPAVGLRTESIPEFQKERSGIFFIILSHVRLAQAGFNGDQDWNAQPGTPLELTRFALDLAMLQQVTILNPDQF